MMKIDVFAHILPQKFFAAFREMVPNLLDDIEERNPYTLFLDQRLTLMNRYPDVLQVVTIGLQHLLDEVVTVEQSIELARMANDELSEIVLHHPDKFYAAIACLPLRDVKASATEIDRAINKLGLKGIQIHSAIAGESPADPKFDPLWGKMAKYDLPIWIHPYQNVGTGNARALGMARGGVFNLVFETTCAMEEFVSSGIFTKYPNIKIIAHHCGAIVPLLEGRLMNKEAFRKFYGDTATYGSTIQINCGYSFFGADHILFGTDSPLGPKFGCTLDVIKSIERMNIPDSDKEKIFWQNAAALLNVAI